MRCGLTLLLVAGECTSACTVDFPSAFGFHGFMKADLRISIKDHRRSKNLKIQLTQVPFAYARQFYVRMNGEPWPKDGRIKKNQKAES